MAFKHRIVQPSRIKGRVLTESGEPLIPPEEWAYLEAGDAAVTRSVKAKGITWVVQIRKGRRTISRGVWADKADIEASRKEVEAKRATPEYAKRRKADLARRSAKQEQYLVDFCAAVVHFLDFHSRYAEEADVLGAKITEHAAPVGSGTVARTERIPLAQRAEAATIAWMRHQTTAYDSMRIARIKGKRREIRRQLAAKSVTLLQAYRHGDDLSENCPLQKALSKESL